MESCRPDVCFRSLCKWKTYSFPNACCVIAYV